MKTSGYILTIIGIIGIIFTKFMNTSVPSMYSEERISNFSLMQAQSNNLLLFCIFLLCGIILMGFGFSSDKIVRSINKSQTENNPTEKQLV